MWLNSARRLNILIALTLVGVALLALIGCGTHVPPGPPTPPTPTPATTVNDQMVLKVQGDKFVRQDGTPFVHKGAIACCFSEESEPNPGWPIATKEWIDFVASKGATILHVRLAPWRIESDDTGTAYRDIGAAYLEVNGKADLTQWNPKFWEYVDNIILYAASKGMWVQVTLVDDWGTKWCKHGGYPGRPNWEYHPWQIWNNIQNQDWCARANTGAIIMGDGSWGVYEALIRKTVVVAGRHGNVIWVIGNETNLVPGYNPAWDISVAQIVRDEEAKRGYKTHPIGTQSETASVVANPIIDYSEWHTQSGPADKNQGRGKPISVNEYNPEPPLTAEQLFSNYCAAEANGTYYWYWRHGQSKAVMDRALDLIKGGCSGVVACSAPPDWQHWVPAGKPAPVHVSQVAEGIDLSRRESGLWDGNGCVVGPKEATTFWAALDDIAFRMRKGGTCAFWSDDAVIARRGDGLLEEYGLIAWGTGCLRPPGNPNVYRGSWKAP